MNTPGNIEHISAETVPAERVKLFEHWYGEYYSGLTAEQRYAADYARIAIKNVAGNKRPSPALIAGADSALEKLSALLPNGEGK